MLPKKVAPKRKGCKSKTDVLGIPTSSIVLSVSLASLSWAATLVGQAMKPWGPSFVPTTEFSPVDSGTRICGTRTFVTNIFSIQNIQTRRSNHFNFNYLCTADTEGVTHRINRYSTGGS